MEEVKKRKTHTSSAVKNRYKKKHYKRIVLELDIGLVDKFKEKLEKDGLNATEFLRNAIKEYLK